MSNTTVFVGIALLWCCAVFGFTLVLCALGVLLASIVLNCEG